MFRDLLTFFPMNAIASDRSSSP
ncbi:hypothetical protein A2U01_0086467 [Trifolium medium]|uniref:Uncharacterized protein n=1 Tax=Trifolium medium TaxID=97028 RepID=A0A392TW76_9FABA|nr:hypothetical protein [Trifolium medium]